MMRIDGIVKVANQVRQQLQAGITVQEADRLKQFVTESIQQIEYLCANNNAHPSQLPTPSRQAYHFLKQLQLEDLEAIDRVHSISTPTLKLKNVLKQQSQLNQQLFHIASKDKAIPASLMSRVKTYAQQIETICSQNQVTPSALAAPSRSAYAWMKFLTDENNLQLHLNSLQRAIAIGTEIIQTQKQGVGELYIEFCHGSSLFKYSTNRNLTHLRMSEGFIRSSDAIMTAVLQSALLGRTKASTQIIRKFGLTEDFSDVLLELDLVAEIGAETAQGNFYNLDEIFNSVNQQYFHGTMAKSRLIWSNIFSQRKFGHYERARDRVVISKALDDHRVPQYAVEFVVYHELLHKHHGIQWVNGKCLAHTPEFRRSEQKFQYYPEAESALRKIALGQKSK